AKVPVVLLHDADARAQFDGKTASMRSNGESGLGLGSSSGPSATRKLITVHPVFYSRAVIVCRPSRHIRHLTSEARSLIIDARRHRPNADDNGRQHQQVDQHNTDAAS